MVYSSRSYHWTALSGAAVCSCTNSTSEHWLCFSCRCLSLAIFTKSNIESLDMKITGSQVPSKCTHWDLLIMTDSFKIISQTTPRWQSSHGQFTTHLSLLRRSHRWSSMPPAVCSQSGHTLLGSLSSSHTGVQSSILSQRRICPSICTHCISTLFYRSLWFSMPSSHRFHFGRARFQLIYS